MGYLKEAILKSFSSDDVIGHLLSGGLDSSIITAMIKNVYPEPFPLFVSGIESAKDLTTAREAANHFNLPLAIRIFTPMELEDRLPTILSLLGTVDVLQVELAIPLFFAAECAKQFNITILFSGLGADELFGGYARHEKQFSSLGSKAALKEMKSDLQKLQTETLPFQHTIVGHFNLELVTPFLDKTLIDFSFALPFKCKLYRIRKEIVRKYLLRILAKELGFPSHIIHAPKRAVQYGSGTHRILAKLATDYWNLHEPELTRREARSHTRISQYLSQLLDEKATAI